MAKWAFTSQGFTPTAVADAANFTDGGYMGLMGGSTTQILDIQQVTLIGLAGASSPTPMVLAKDSTVQATPTALATPNSNGSMDSATAALAAAQIAFVASTTKPQRGTALAKVAMGFNAFGGSFRWDMPFGAPFTLVGNAVNLGEASLSAFTGGTPGLMMATIVYEPH